MRNFLLDSSIKFTSKHILHELSIAIYDFMCLQRALNKKQKRVFAEFIEARKEI